MSLYFTSHIFGAKYFVITLAEEQMLLIDWQWLLSNCVPFVALKVIFNAKHYLLSETIRNVVGIF